MSDMASSIKKNAIGLTLFALVTAGLVGSVQMITKEKIAVNVQAAKARALFEIVPEALHNNDMLPDALALNPENLEPHKSTALFDTSLLGPIKPNSNAYYARQDGKIVAIILPAIAPDGYTTQIELIVGVTPVGKVAGVRVVSHKETPGLGDKIDAAKSDWIKSFNNKALSESNKAQWQVIKDGGTFDQFTGATITPRAVVNAVSRTLSFFNRNKELLLSHAAPKSVATKPSTSPIEVNHGD